MYIFCGKQDCKDFLPEIHKFEMLIFAIVFKWPGAYVTRLRIFENSCTYWVHFSFRIFKCMYV